MLKVAYIGFGNSVCRYHLPYVEKRKDFIDVKYIYRLETEINEERGKNNVNAGRKRTDCRIWQKDER